MGFSKKDVSFHINSLSIKILDCCDVLNLIAKYSITVSISHPAYYLEKMFFVPFKKNLRRVCNLSHGKRDFYETKSKIGPLMAWSLTLHPAFDWYVIHHPFLTQFCFDSFDMAYYTIPINCSSRLNLLLLLLFTDRSEQMTKTWKKMGNCRLCL